MNFFRDKELAQRFAADKVSEKEIFYYFLISSLLFYLLTTTTFMPLIEIKATFWDYVHDSITLVLALIGMIWTFSINSKGDNKNFVTRFVSLSFPIGIKCIILFFILCIPLVAIEIINEEKYNKNLLSEDWSVISSSVAALLILLYYYLRLAYSMKIASSPSKASE